MDDIRKRLIVASLLHDIGKFYQRADKALVDKANELSEQSLNIAGLICPLNQNGNFGYQHTVWTHQFLSEKEPMLKGVQGLVENIYQQNSDSVFQLASFHHKPSSELQAIVSLADCWSAGIDRKQSNLEQEDGDSYGVKWGNKRYKKIPLYSVFNKIFNSDYHFAFDLHPLSIETENFFPTEIKEVSNGVSESKYADLWKQFSEEFDNLPTDSFDAFADSLIFLLKKYTWCIPSNTTDMANVSLFDHLKTTAAFADSLYVYKQYNADAFKYDGGRITIKQGCYPVILLGGDLSGIQKFIYNITSRKAAVSLKGRSFYLQLLIDSIIQRIISCADIDVTFSNVVYSSGGKFHMILPNTEKVTNAIAQLKNEFDTYIWNEFYGQLIFNLEYIPFAYNSNGGELYYEGVDANTATIGGLWQSLAEKLTLQKNKKFKNLLVEQYDNFFEVQKVGGEGGVCSVTGVESSNLISIDKKGDGEKTNVLPIVKKQIELGETLKDADFIITYTGKTPNSYLSNRSKCNISCVGVENYLFDQRELTKDDSDFRTITSVDVCRVKRINQTSFIIPIKGNGCGYGFQFYGGNKQALNRDESNKTFEQLADKSYLGILRMDVDNLGSIFINGLPEEDKSFSAYSTLSFMLDYFFSGYLNTIRERDEFRDDVNILYSGGDDVFAIGRWNKLITFAEAIREDFKKFVGRNDISISGGITIVGPKFPIAKAAEMAGDAEDSAKKYNYSSKNSLCLFCECVSWNDEFDYVKSFKDELVDLITKYDTFRSILHKFMTYYDMQKRGDISYFWHYAYSLTRYMKQYDEKKNKDISDFCERMRNKELKDKNFLRLIAIASRWAELELRFKKNNNQNI